MAYQIDQLKNGLRLLRLPVPQVESISAVAIVRTGSRYEQASNYGVAHFLEHMVFKGTKKYPTTKKISQTLDGVGAAYNAFTSEESTAFYVKAASKNLDLALDMLGQMTTQMLIDPAEIERERGVILEEIHMYNDQPDSYNAMTFNKMFYKGSGIAHDILGTPTTIKKMAREDFIKYLDTWYGAANILVVIAGKKTAVMAPEVIAKVEQAWQFAKTRKMPPKHQGQWAPSDFGYGDKLYLTKKPTEQMHYLFGWPGINRFDKRDVTLGLLSTIVGGNMSSRLFTQVRERRGLCYYVHSFTDIFSDVGCFGSGAGVNPAKLLDAIKVSLEEFYSLAAGKRAITAAELQRAKNYLTGHLILAQESIHDAALGYGMQLLHEDKIETIQERISKIEKVTLDQVRELARLLLQPAGLRLSLIGDYTGAQEKEIRELLDEKK